MKPMMVHQPVTQDSMVVSRNESRRTFEKISVDIDEYVKRPKMTDRLVLMTNELSAANSEKISLHSNLN